MLHLGWRFLYGIFCLLSKFYALLSRGFIRTAVAGLIASYKSTGRVTGILLLSITLCFIGLEFRSEELPDLSGMTIEEVKLALLDHNAAIEIQLSDSLERRGVVIRHIPGAGGTLGNSRELLLFLSDGVVLPDGLVGLPVSDAEIKISELGATAQTVTREIIRDQGNEVDGAVIETFPVEGARFDATLEPVNLIVTSVIKQIIPHNLSHDGQYDQETKRRLEALGFVVKIDRLIPTTDIPRPPENPCLTWIVDSVMTPTPPRGSVAEIGSTVILTVVRSEPRLFFEEGPHCNEARP